jgi:hypothetical protein
MANPNIVNVVSIYGKTKLLNCIANGTSNFSDIVPSDTVAKINTILACNVGTTAATFSLSIVGTPSITAHLIKDVIIPAGATLSLLESAVYLEDTSYFSAVVADANVDLVLSYESISSTSGAS